MKDPTQEVCPAQLCNAPLHKFLGAVIWRYWTSFKTWTRASGMPGRYVGTEEEIDDGVPFDEKMKTLTTKLAEQFAKGAELEKTIRDNLKGIGYGF